MFKTSPSFVTLDYTILETGNNRKLVIVNKSAKIVKTQLLTNNKNQLLVKLDNLAQGEYICFILVNGKSIGSKKIQVIK